MGIFARVELHGLALKAHCRGCPAELELAAQDDGDAPRQDHVRAAVFENRNRPEQPAARVERSEGVACGVSRQIRFTGAGGRSS